MLSVDFGWGVLKFFSFLQFGQGIAGPAMHCLRVASGFQRVMCSIDPGHGGDLINSGVSPLNIAVDESPVLFQIQSNIVVYFRRDEAVADIFHRFAAELL
jgi:hypothetical protein